MRSCGMDNHQVHRTHRSRTQPSAAMLQNRAVWAARHMYTAGATLARITATNAAATHELLLGLQTGHRRLCGFALDWRLYRRRPTLGEVE